MLADVKADLENFARVGFLNLELVVGGDADDLAYGGDAVVVLEDESAHGVIVVGHGEVEVEELVYLFYL